MVRARYSFEVPIRTSAWANARAHWRALDKRKKKEKDALFCCWLTAGKPKPMFPCRVTFTRIAPRGLDKDDNLPSAFKYMRDELAIRCFGLKGDGGAEITWKYDQRKGKPKEFSVLVEIVDWGGTECKS